MKLFKKQVMIPENELFKENGEFNLTMDLANLLDTILIICIAKGSIDFYNLNLELRKCGFFMTHPELKKIVDRLIKDNMINKGMIKSAIQNN